MAMLRVSEAERKFVIGGVEEGIREDGRAPMDYRYFTIETGLIAQANGSARVRLAGTDVLVGIKTEIGQPLASAPDEGRFQVSVDFAPTATPEFEEHELSEKLGLQVSDVITSMLSNNQALDRTKLGIAKGQQCWVVYIDCMVLDYAGNVCDAAAIAVKAALRNTKIPAITLIAGEKPGEMEITVSDDPFDVVTLDVSNVPVTVTFTRVGRTYIVDANSVEEFCMSSSVTFAINSKKEVCAIQKLGGGCVEPSALVQLMESAQGLAAHVHGKLQKILELEDKLDRQRGVESAGSKLGFFASRQI